jgi:ABC-2 type transport system ATP-binding protein
MIRVDGLSKRYGGPTGKVAVDDISFEVRRGEVLGFLGPNGAGKTTTMKILTSFLAPSSGRAEVAGHDVYADSLEARKRIGYLPEDTPLYRDLTVLEYLDYIAELRGVESGDARTKRLKRAVDLCGLGDRLGMQIGELSKGFRQRVGLAQAILHEPDVLVLDEPTSGLDPNQIVEIRQVIKHIGEEKTVIFSTHILGEVQATCSRVLIISDGKIVANDTPANLSSGGRPAITVEVGGQRQTAEEVKPLLLAIPGVEGVEGGGNGDQSTIFRITAKSGADPRGDIARVLATAKDMDLLGLSASGASLEDVFRRLTQSTKASA